MNRGALLDKTGTYRYALWREWDGELPPVLWVMLNPSTADADVDDATIRKCVTLSKQFGYGCLAVANLFSFRATDPKNLHEFCKQGDPIGPHTDSFLSEMNIPGLDVICAWGSNIPKQFSDRPRQVLDLLVKANTFALRLSKDGHPWHPLYLPSSIKPMPWKGEKYTRA